MAVNIHITIIELNALHTKRQNLFQELDAVIHLLMEAKHWGLRKSRNVIMSNIQTGAERMPHDLSHLGFLAGQIGRLITISTTPVIAGDSFEMDAVGALRLSPLRRG